MSEELAEAVGRVIIGDAPLDPDAGADVDRLALVRRAVQVEGITRTLLGDVVRSARAGGHSWGEIGSELGISRQAAQQRFGAQDDADGEDGSETRWLGPVTAFDEMAELQLAGRMGWRTVAAGLLRHKVRRTDTQWETRRVLFARPASAYEQDGWVVGCRAFPWLYLVRDLGLPPEPEDGRRTGGGRGSPQNPIGSPA